MSASDKGGNGTTTTMRRSWLVQRLRKPRGAGMFGKDNPFAFGGGLRNGGLSDEAMDLLRGVFGFDYMGAAEFEFGAVPKALQKIAKDSKTYTTFQIKVLLRDVAPHWKDKSKETPEGDATVYVICRQADAGEVETRIRGWASVKYGEKLKESTHLARALRPVEEWDTETCGWLELDNGFFFFTDPEMWEQTASLFGVQSGRPWEGEQ